MEHASPICMQQKTAPRNMYRAHIQQSCHVDPTAVSRSNEKERVPPSGRCTEGMSATPNYRGRPTSASRSEPFQERRTTTAEAACPLHRAAKHQTFDSPLQVSHLRLHERQATTAKAALSIECQKQHSTAFYKSSVTLDCMLFGFFSSFA